MKIVLPFINRFYESFDSGWKRLIEMVPLSITCVNGLDRLHPQEYIPKGHIELADLYGFDGLESVPKNHELKHIEFIGWVH
jgi:hypothetical protein